MDRNEKIELLKILTALYQSSNNGYFKEFLMKKIVSLIEKY